MDRPSIDTDVIWQQAGLQQLRQSLQHIERASADFARALRALPPCTACARRQLLEYIEATGRKLGAKSGSLSALAASLQEALTAAETAAAVLREQPPAPCRCRQGSTCTCHER